MRRQKKKTPWALIYILVTMVAVLIFTLLNQQVGELIYTLQELETQYLVLSIAAVTAFLALEGFIIYYLLKSQGESLKLINAMKTSVIGLYYCYITPSATGGQPVQVAYLKRDDKIDVGTSAAILSLKFLTYQIAFMLLAFFSLFFMWNKLHSQGEDILPFIYFGIGVNALWIILIPLLFIKKVLNFVCRLVEGIVNKIKLIKRKEKYIKSVQKFEKDFLSSGERLRNNKKSIIISTLLSIPLVILQMGVLYLVFLSFECTKFGFFEITSMQTLLQATVSFMPMPGAAGAQEIGFVSYFSDYLDESQIMIASLVWRFFTYYIVVIFGAFIVVLDEILHTRKKMKRVELIRKASK